MGEDKTDTTDEDNEEPILKPLEFNFKGWNIGGKLIFISTLIAILSLLLPWIAGDADAEMGFKQGGSLFLITYIYPFFILAQDKSMNNAVGMFSSILAVILPSTFLYYMSRQIRQPMPEIISYGLMIFLIAGIILIIGVLKYVPYDREHDRLMEKEEKPKRGKPCPDCDHPMEYEEEWERWFCEECGEYK